MKFLLPQRKSLVVRDLQIKRGNRSPSKSCWISFCQEILHSRRVDNSFFWCHHVERFFCVTLNGKVFVDLIVVIVDFPDDDNSHCLFINTRINPTLARHSNQQSFRQHRHALPNFYLDFVSLLTRSIENFATTVRFEVCLTVCVWKKLQQQYFLKIKN